MSEPSRPVSVSAWDWITAAEHAHTEGVRAIVAGIRGRDDLRQWASVRAATIRAKGAVNADELRLILDVIDTSAALVLSPDKAAALSCDVRWAMQQAGLAPGSENVKALRVALAALQVAETRLPFTGTQPAEGEKPPAAESPTTTQQAEGEKPTVDNAESPTTPQPTEAKPTVATGRRGVPLAEANILVRDWLMQHAKDDPASITRDAVAKGAGVSPASVSRTAAWKAFRERRDAEKKPRRRERSLTDGMLSTIPSKVKRPEELIHLIEEQRREMLEEERRYKRRSENRSGPF